MQVSLFFCHFAVMLGHPLVLVLTLAIFWAGYLLFGLEPSPSEER